MSNAKQLWIQEFLKRKSSQSNGNPSESINEFFEQFRITADKYNRNKRVLYFNINELEDESIPETQTERLKSQTFEKRNFHKELVDPSHDYPANPDEKDAEQVCATAAPNNANTLKSDSENAVVKFSKEKIIYLLCEPFHSQFFNTCFNNQPMIWTGVLPSYLFPGKEKLAERLAKCSMPTVTALKKIEELCKHARDPKIKDFLFPVEKLAIKVFWRPFLSVLFLVQEDFGTDEFRELYLMKTIYSLGRFGNGDLMKLIAADLAFKNYLKNEMDFIRSICLQ